MASTSFVPQSTRIASSWLNAINGFFYDLFQGAVTAQQACEAIGATRIEGTPTDGQVPVWSGTAWVPETPSGGSEVSVGVISDDMFVSDGSGYTCTVDYEATSLCYNIITYNYSGTDAKIAIDDSDGDFPAGTVLLFVMNTSYTTPLSVEVIVDTGGDYAYPEGYNPIFRAFGSSIGAIKLNSNQWVLTGDMEPV